MDEKNGVDVPRKEGIPDDNELRNDEALSGGQAFGSASSQESAANSDSPADAAINQEDKVDDIPGDSVEEAENAELLSQEEIDNALRRQNQEEAADGNQAEMAAVINSAVQGLNPGDLSMARTTSVKAADFQQLSSSDKGGAPRNIDLLMDVELPVSIELGRTRMDISSILALGPGSIVELEKLVGEPVDLLVNNKCVAHGEVVVVEENFGLRITQLISPEERIKNLQ
jgi:flagellar motor switch protein FliN/FliY